MLYFATLFDKNYYSRGMALLSSMQRHITHFHLFVLCLDDVVFEQITKLKNKKLTPIRLAELETTDPALFSVKGERSWAEYIFTLSPCWPLFLLKKYAHIDLIVTLDADIYFFASPGPLLHSFATKSVMITPHNFSPRLLALGKQEYGKYNVSFQGFRRDEVSLQCLTQWRSACVEWCYDQLEGNRYADQKYLNTWEEQFGPSVAPIDYPGAGIAPWNMENYHFTSRWGKVQVDDKPLIYYHFHHARFIRQRIVTLGLADYEIRNIPKILLNQVYAPYFMLMLKHQNGADQMKRYLKSYKEEEVARMLDEDIAHLLVTGNWLTASNRAKSILKYFPHWISN